MVIRILLIIMLMVLGSGFIFFMANVLWLGTKAFFAKYNSSSKITTKKKTRKAKAKAKAKAKVDEYHDNIKEKING